MNCGKNWSVVAFVLLAGGCAARQTMVNYPPPAYYTAGQVSAIWQAAAPRFAECYAAKSDLSGGSVHQFVVRADGKVVCSQVKDNRLSDPVVGRCLQQKILELRFPDLGGSGHTEVEYPFLFGPATAGPVLHPAAAPAKRSDPDEELAQVNGVSGLERQQILNVVLDNLAAVQFCYERMLAEKPQAPALQGKVVSNWIINQEGQVICSTIKRSEIHNWRMENCLQERILRFTFPKSKAGTVEVTFPFLFRVNLLRP